MKTVQINFSKEEVLIIREYISFTWETEWMILEGEILHMFSNDGDLELYLNQGELSALLKAEERYVAPRGKYPEEVLKDIYNRIRAAWNRLVWGLK